MAHAHVTATVCVHFINYHINFEVVLCFCNEEHINFPNPVIWIFKNLAAHQFGANIFHGLVTFSPNLVIPIKKL